MQFNERIKSLREREKLTQKQIAEILDISKSAYVKYERGEREPRYGILLALSQYFDVTVDYILGKSNEENPYVDTIDELKNIVQSTYFSETHGKNKKNAQKMLADYMQIALLSEYDMGIMDSLYCLVQIEKKMLLLQEEGRHLFCYENWAKEDPEYRVAVPEPTAKDMEEFMQNIKELRQIVDEYIAMVSSADYHTSHKDYFEKEISEYANVNREKLIEEFKNDPRYKMRLK